MRSAIVRLGFSVLFTGTLWGCSPMTEQQKYERTERLNLAKEEFQAREQQCEKRGGVMHMRTRPLEKPGYLDYRAASCIRR